VRIWRRIKKGVKRELGLGRRNYVYHYGLEYVHEAFDSLVNCIHSVIDVLRPTPGSRPNRSVNHLTLTINTDFVKVACASEFDESLCSRSRNAGRYWRSTELQQNCQLTLSLSLT
jgi:hypothetical protein